MQENKTNKDDFGKDDFKLDKDSVVAVLLLGVFVAVIIIVIAFFVLLVGGEREGYLNTSDCREEVYLKVGSFSYYSDKFMHKFTCNSWGECCRVKLKDGICRTSYCYERDVATSK